MREWWAKWTPEQKREKTARRDKDRQREQDRRKMQKRRREGTPEQKQRIAARAAVREALARGDLERGTCENVSLDCAGPIHAHHDDYGRPLDVRWFCRLHHDMYHEALANLNTQSLLI